MLLSVVIVCCVFGIVVIASAVHSFENSERYILMQSAAFVIGLLCMFIVAAIDYEYYGAFAKLIYVLCIGLLVLVLFFGIGLESTGSKSWIRFGPIGFQPSEFVKIGFIITFAKHLSQTENVNKPKSLLFLLLHAAPIIALVLLEPDFGTAMVFLCIFAGMLLVAGLSWKYILSAFVLIGASIPVVWHFLADYQKNRILVFFNPESDPFGAGYHVIQSKIAIGSGQIFGKGLFKGTQTQLEYLPVKHTDFIFAVIGEELGLIGCILVVGLLLTLVVRCIYVSGTARNTFGSYICIGVAFLFMAHIFENIGMCIGLMPVTGIPLPFFSAAGTSLVANLIAIGLVLNVYMRRRTRGF